MTPLVYDFETFWSQDFTLAKMSFMEYIMSPEFEVISVSVKIGNEPTITRFGSEVETLLKSIDWSDKVAIAHNGNEFDHPLLVWKYGVQPAMFADTLAMAKAKHQSGVGGSLKKLSAIYGLPDKVDNILHSTKGKHYIDFSLSEMTEMARYNKVDVENCRALFGILAKETLPEEFMLMDMTARMIIYPQLNCDTAMLRSALEKVVQQKQDMLEEVAGMIGCLDAAEAKTELASAPKFAKALEALGVEVPMKTSPTTGKQIPALAKSDDGLQELLEHDDPRVQTAVAARLGVKSTLLETRINTMIKCSDVMGGRMPIPLAYHSATTGRWGGRVWNPQNLPRIPRDKQGGIIDKPTNVLRLALVAPPGCKVVVSDLSGIELRVNHYLWAVESTQRLYDTDPRADLYLDFAAALFGVSTADVTKESRQLAKVAQLGLGFGAGAGTFKRVAKAMGGIILNDLEATRVTSTWRIKYSDIVNGWRKCQAAVEAMSKGLSFNPDPRMLCETGPCTLRLPSGRKLYYPNLHQKIGDDGKRQFMYGEGRNTSKVYSGLMDENIVQAIARDVIAKQALEIRHQTGYSPAHMVHDELVYVIPEDRAEQHLNDINAIMRTSPKWLPGIVLWSEGSIGDSYGAAK
jgi:DNA polymerase